MYFTLGWLGEGFTNCVLNIIINDCKKETLRLRVLFLFILYHYIIAFIIHHMALAQEERRVEKGNWFIQYLLCVLLMEKVWNL